MNLISDDDRLIYEAAQDDLHDTFKRAITLVNEVKTPVQILDDGSDDYDFTQNINTGSEEFNISYTESTIYARIKYIDKQDKEFALVTTVGGEQINLVQEFGVLRIKVAIADCQSVSDASSIIVDGNNCKIFFRDRPHGLFSPKYCTFYLQRIP